MIMMFTWKDYNKGVTSFNPTQKCRPTKGISKRVNVQMIKCTYELYIWNVSDIQYIDDYVHICTYVHKNTPGKIHVYFYIPGT
jgi:hypothetical protein